MTATRKSGPVEGHNAAAAPASTPQDSDARGVGRTGVQPEALSAFANRLAKNRAHWGRWARRRGFGAYRVYHRDLPEFPLAIDVYVAEDPAVGTRVHLQEIETGWEQNEADAAAWRAAVHATVASVLELPERAIVFKQRARRHGRDQHVKTGRAARPFVVVESGLRFEVDLDSYLDTGLFLDHRALRALVRERAAGRRMLNLFAYTGSFTVYAAAGGAVASDTVDLSNTYLDWAGRNFARNGLDPARHVRERADVLAWLPQAAEEGRRWDLIVLDPPAFSNSKAMDDVLDVQRDHAAMIMAARGLLATDGELFFSTNLRSFVLDPRLAADPAVDDITARTQPEDFRDARIHRSYRIRG